MNHNTTTKFWKLYYNLSEAVQALADKNFSLLKADPLHPSLHFKEISGKDNLWAARVGDHFRALLYVKTMNYIGSGLALMPNTIE